MKRMSFTIALILTQLLSGAVAQQGATINDKEISVIDYQDMNYPHIALVAHVQGVVVVRVNLDKHGKVLSAIALSGASLLTGPSVENAKSWRFESNPENAVIIVYNFRIEGACHYRASPSQLIFFPPNLAAITACPGPPQP